MAFVRSLSNSRGTWNGGVRSGFLRAHCPLHLFGVQTAPKNAHTLRRSFCLACRPEAAHTRHTAVPAPAVGVCNGRRGPMARIVGGCGPCVRRKAARPRWFVHGTSAPSRLKSTVSSLTCRRGMAESTAESRRFSGYDRPGPSRESHPRCLRGGVAWLRRVVCKHLPTPPRKIKKQALKVTTRQ